jgi:hypothetical protein
MRMPRQSVTILAAAGLLVAVSLEGDNSAVSSQATAAPSATSVATQERGGQEMYGHYEVVENWLQPLPDGEDGVKHEGWTWGSQAAVYAETPDRIWIAQRGELPLPKGAKPWTPYAQIIPSPGSATAPRLPVMRYHHVIFVVDRNGKMVQSWPQHDKLFDQPSAPLSPRGPHKIKMSPYDPQKHVWVIDDNLHQIFKFTYDGKLVMTLGQMGVEGRGPNTFARPTDIAWLPDGTFFISDGYHGKRVAKFDKDGKFLMDWGSAPADPKNPGPNEWNTVHSIAITKDRKIYVADRGHERFQVFDENGKFLDMFPTRDKNWPTGVQSLPYYHLITDDQSLWVGDGGTQRILKYDLKGNYLYGWGQPGGKPGQFWGPHQMTVDQEGNLYVAEVQNGRIQKFRPKPNADRAKIAGQEVRLGTSSQ